MRYAELARITFKSTPTASIAMNDKICEVTKDSIPPVILINLNNCKYLNLKGVHTVSVLFHPAGMFSRPT